MQPRLLLLAFFIVFIALNSQAQNTFPASGNVGIGTTSPQQRLHVEGTSNRAIFVSTTAPSTTSGSGVVNYMKATPTAANQRLGYFMLGSRGGAQNSYNQAGTLGYAGGAWSSTSRPAFLSFETTPSGSTTRVERLRITAEGNVGIGTPTPLARLGVRRTDGISKLAKFSNGSTSGDRSALIDLQSGDNALWHLSVGGTGNPYGPSNGEFYIGRGEYNQPLLVIDNDGQINVGSSVNQRLRVLGDIRVASTEDPGSGIGGTGIRSDGEYVGIEAFGGEVAGISARTYNGVAVEGLLVGEDQGTYAGYFGGPIYYTGAFEGSDRKLKQNITEFSSALQIINKLQPKSYEYRQDGDYKLMHLPKGKHFGLVAQDVEEILPDLVKDSKFDIGRAKSFRNFKRDSQQAKNAKPTSDRMDFKAVNYTELIPIMVKGMQEQDANSKSKEERIAALEKENSDIKQQLAELKALITGKNTTVSANASNVYLEQNTPNPTGSSTNIRYGIPDGATSAKLTLTNSKGQLLKTVGLSSRGAGQVALNTSSLPAGMYTYSLWVDGREAASKQLVIAR